MPPSPLLHSRFTGGKKAGLGGENPGQSFPVLMLHSSDGWAQGDREREMIWQIFGKTGADILFCLKIWLIWVKKYSGQHLYQFEIEVNPFVEVFFLQFTLVFGKFMYLKPNVYHFAHSALSANLIILYSSSSSQYILAQACDHGASLSKCISLALGVPQGSVYFHCRGGQISTLLCLLPPSDCEPDRYLFVQKERKC